jgi:hypothetical protein
MRIELEQDKLAEIADHVGEEQGKWLDKINTKQELSKLDHWIFIQYRMNAKKDSKELRDMIEHKISLASFKNHLPGSSFKIDRNYFSIWSVYYLLKADFQKYNLYVSRMYELYEKQYPHQKNNDRIAYKVILFNYVYSLQMVKDFESMSRLLDHSQTIAPLNEDEAGETFQNQVFYKQLYYMNTSKFEEAVEMVPEIEEGIKKYRRKINTARQLTLYSNIAISYMMVNKWPEVLTYTEKIIAEKTSVRMEIKYEAMLHQLIARYELKQYDLLSYQIRNTQRQLNGKDTLTDAQAYVIKLLNSLIKDEKKHFTSLRKDADIAVANCKGYGVIQIWLYSRLYNISMIKAAPLLEH